MPLSTEPLLDWVQGRDLNPRPSGYEPDELPDCSTLQHFGEEYGDFSERGKSFLKNVREAGVRGKYVVLFWACIKTKDTLNYRAIFPVMG